MIEPVRRQSRTGLWIVISVLLVVVAFWAWRLTQSQRFQGYIYEVQLKRTLRTINPPPGAKVESIIANHSDIYGYSIVYGAGIYSSDLEFDKVKSHYLGEFARRGFIYQGDTVKDTRVEVHFCAADYRATLSPASGPSQHLYMIFLERNNGPC